MTEYVRLQEEWRETDRLIEDLQVRAERMESEIFLRARSDKKAIDHGSRLFARLPKTYRNALFR